MGQEQSQHDLFLNQVKEALQARGIVVKKKGLSEFFRFIIKTCPWFPEEGTIDERCWKRVSDCLNDYYKTFGPSRIPVTAFSYCQLIYEMIRASPCFPDVTEIITEGENILKSQTPSGAPSRAPSIASLAGNSLEINPLPNGSHQNGGNPLSLLKGEKPSLNYQDGALPPSPSFEEQKSKPAGESPASLYPPLPVASPSWRGADKEPRPSCLPHKVNQADAVVTTASAPLNHHLLPPQINFTPREIPVFEPPPYATANHLSPLAPPTSASVSTSPLPDFTPIIILTEKLETLAHTLIGAASPSRPNQVYPILRSGRSTSAGPRPPVRVGDPLSTPLPDSDDDEADDQGESNGPQPSERGTASQPEAGVRTRPLTLLPDVHCPLTFKTIEKLKKAVYSYGPTAPFTLALIEALGEKELTPNDWFQLAKAVLSGGDFITWRSHYEEASRERAMRNALNEETRSWTVKKFLGQGSAQSNAAQAQFSAGLISQIQGAALKAWKKLPQKNHPASSLAKLTQGPEEPFADFLSRLQTTAEHLFRDADTGCDFIKQLAFENANESCQQAIRPFRNTDLSNWVRLCANVTAAKTIGMAIGAAIQKSLANPPICFNCQQTGHFVKSCPLKSMKPSRPSPTPVLVINKPRPARPNTVCPRCKKGFHWASDCHSNYNINGQPIEQAQLGNFFPGQPQAPPRANPGAIRFVQPTTPTTPALPPVSHPAASLIYGEQQQGVQDWTSVPPPQQY
ncbi:endogenous retrovirus group K member 9 Gag polyprotein-like [Dasypus novemcinctus]|uniref:endogenous retrovirus group K member 9 Gag polyprotein-like n=1 Tax=Dasypus novemcinctus TaxID=9361 RepID=UPI00265E6853|nr:endogenous retrovirus group K member 5 Gag polyprotein-like [Dasypus novemcinctus]